MTSKHCSDTRAGNIVMAYLARKRGQRHRRALQGLGDLASIVNTVSASLGTAVNVAEDPYLPEIVCHVGQLQQINAGQAPGACTELPDGLPGGVGLSAAVKPFRFYVYAKQNVWVFPAVALAILGIPFMLGYEWAKGGE